MYDVTEAHPYDGASIVTGVGIGEQYASAMAVLLRTIGIPARVATGFTPGDAVGDGTDTYSVGTSDLHAWVEVPFQGYGWLPFEQAASASEDFAPDGPTNADEPMLLYFTSGTTAKPKLVRHSQRSYPVGALSTMFWLGFTSWNLRHAPGVSTCTPGCSPTGTSRSWHAAQNGS